jgi:uncharacterized membrane protein YjjP (DUF1212 family)
MKICLVCAELFHGDRRMDRRTDRLDEANSLFRNIANAPKKWNRFYETFASQLVSLNILRK